MRSALHVKRDGRTRESLARLRPTDAAQHLEGEEESKRPHLHVRAAELDEGPRPGSLRLTPLRASRTLHAVPRNRGFARSEVLMVPRRFAPFVASLLVAGSAAGQVVINELSYDDHDADDDEFIELFNAGSSPVDISGWTIDCGDSPT